MQVRCRRPQVERGSGSPVGSGDDLDLEHFAYKLHAATAAALWLRAWTPLAGLALLALRPGLGAWLRRLRQGRAAAELAASRREPGFDQAEFERLVASVCQEQCQT